MDTGGSIMAPRLIHYIGDENIAVNFPHGNSKGEEIFHRTYPSVMSRLASSTTHDLPGNIYKKELIALYNINLTFCRVIQSK